MYRELDSINGENGKITVVEHLYDRNTKREPTMDRFTITVENRVTDTRFVQKCQTAKELFSHLYSFIYYLNSNQMDKGENVLLKHRGEKRFEDAMDSLSLELVANSGKSSLSVYASKPVSKCCRAGSFLETDDYVKALNFYKKKEKQMWVEHKHK